MSMRSLPTCLRMRASAFAQSHILLVVWRSLTVYFIFRLLNYITPRFKGSILFEVCRDLPGELKHATYVHFDPTKEALNPFFLLQIYYHSISKQSKMITEILALHYTHRWGTKCFNWIVNGVKMYRTSVGRGHDWEQVLLVVDSHPTYEQRWWGPHSKRITGHSGGGGSSPSPSSLEVQITQSHLTRHSNNLYDKNKTHIGALQKKEKEQ